MASSGSNFSIREAVSFGWRSVVGDLKFFVPVVLVVGGIMIIFQFVQTLLQRNDTEFLSLLIALVYVFVQLLVTLGIIRVVVNYVRKKKATIAQLFGESRLVLRYLLATILVSLPVLVVFGVGVGVIVLIMSGVVGEFPLGIAVLVGVVVAAFAIYWQTKMQFYSYFMVDKNVGVVESLRKSFRATDGHFWKLVWLGVLLGLINLLGLLALVVGLLVTIPLGWVARVYVYNAIADSR